MKKPAKAVMRFKYVKDPAAAVPLERMREVNIVEAVDVPLEHVVERHMVDAVEMSQLGHPGPLKDLARVIADATADSVFAAELQRAFRAEGTKAVKKAARDRRAAGEVVPSWMAELFAAVTRDELADGERKRLGRSDLALLARKRESDETRRKLITVWRARLWKETPPKP